MGWADGGVGQRARVEAGAGAEGGADGRGLERRSVGQKEGQRNLTEVARTRVEELAREKIGGEKRDINKLKIAPLEWSIVKQWEGENKKRTRRKREEKKREEQKEEEEEEK